MATKVWRGDAQVAVQVDKVTFANIDFGDIFTVTINRKALAFACSAGATAQLRLDNVVAGLVALIGSYSNTIPEFAEVKAEASYDADGNIDGFTLTGPTDGKPFTATVAATNVASILIEETTPGTGSVNEVQTVTLPPSATGGTFTLTYDGQTTSALTYDESAADIETALEALSNIDAVAVTGSDGGPWTVEFQGTLALTDVDLMTATSSLTGTDTQTMTLTPVATPSGPNWASDADNWHNPAAPSTPTTPQNGDTVIFRNSTVSMLYGLEEFTGDTWAAMEIEASYTGSIGLPTWNTSGYWEYRPTSLLVGITSLVVGVGEGSGSPRLRFNMESVDSAIEVYRTGSSLNDLPAMCFKGSGTNSTLTVHRGSVGAAVEQAGDTATLASVTMGYLESQDRDAEVWLGDGVGTVASVTKSGGILHVYDVPITALVQTGGEVDVDGNETIAAATIYTGDLIYYGDGTITSLTVGAAGSVDFSRAQQARTVTSCSLYAGAKIEDPHGSVTWTNPIALVKCRLEDVTIDVGSHKTLAIGNGA